MAHSFVPALDATYTKPTKKHYSQIELFVELAVSTIPFQLHGSHTHYRIHFHYRSILFYAFNGLSVTFLWR